jgi:hypothetical protein
MPKESAAFIVLFGTAIGVLWTFFASISSVDREIPPITSLSSAATWLLLWPGYLTWAGAGVLVLLTMGSAAQTPAVDRACRAWRTESERRTDRTPTAACWRTCGISIRFERNAALPVTERAFLSTLPADDQA